MFDEIFSDSTYKMKFVCVLLIIYFVLTSIVTKGFPNDDTIVFPDDNSVSPRKNQNLTQSDNGDVTIQFRSFFNVRRNYPVNYIKRSGICVPKCPKKYILVGSFCYPEDR